MSIDIDEWVDSLPDKAPTKTRAYPARFGSVEQGRRQRTKIRNKKNRYAGDLAHCTAPLEGYVSNAPAVGYEQGSTPIVKEIYVRDASMRGMRPKGEIHENIDPYPEKWRKTKEKRRPSNVPDHILDLL